MVVTRSLEIVRREIAGQSCSHSVCNNRPHMDITAMRLKTNLVIMAALWNRAGHYIFALWFLSSSYFFPRLISAVADWMSTILLHMFTTVGVALVRI